MIFLAMFGAALVVVGHAEWLAWRQNKLVAAVRADVAGVLPILADLQAAGAATRRHDALTRIVEDACHAAEEHKHVQRRLRDTVSTAHQPSAADLREFAIDHAWRQQAALRLDPGFTKIEIGSAIQARMGRGRPTTSPSV